MRRVDVITVGPDPTSLNGTASSIRGMCGTRPDPGAESVNRIVGNLDRVIKVFKGGHSQYRPEDFFLESLHVIGAFKDGRFNIETLTDFLTCFTTGQDLCAFFTTSGNTAQNLVLLFLRSLRANHGVSIQGMPGFNALHPLYCTRQKFIGNTFLYQGTGRTGTDFTLVQGKHGKALQSLIQIVIFLIHDVGKEQVW